ncbi:MAG TPA: fumarylacetoacetate hydrolase family protein [Burkholderiaceae bacterium]|nr:fumarylacetoacetate hydrolase family protein [Rhodoferax sp.]HQZ05305.1 fumarylacetoacetate hydrolase family protein [Burkholderiaceae bacterium]HRA62360.1 fumarylacetoacetate hydrolase family protein [Burkholderiaceae bacterium]
MKICRFNGGRLGVVEDGLVHDVSSVLDRLPAQRYPLPQKDLLVEALPQLREPMRQAMHGAQTHAVGAVAFDSPVANPGKIIGAPINYQDHLAESKADAGIAHGRKITSIGDWGLFLKAGSSLIGCGQEIVLRFDDRRNDHEVELGVVIGSTCRQVSQADAMAHVAGYAVALDMTVRGTEFQSFRKSIDTYAVLGPWLVTADEIADPNQLDLWLRVNGQPRQQSNTRHLVYNIARLIAYASSFYTLAPGDVIMTGTPQGVGPVLPGDRIEAGVQGVGAFEIRVADAYAGAAAGA